MSRRDDSPVRWPAAQQGGPIGVLCFGGDLPVDVAAAAQARGESVLAVAFRGFADPSVERLPHIWVKLGQIGRLLRALRSRSIERIVIVGAMTRPSLRDLSLDWTGLLTLPRILDALRCGGDDKSLRRVATFFEEQGLTVMGVAEVAPEFLAGEGRLGRVEVREVEARNATIGLSVLDALSPFDIGQACIVLDGRPVAIEGAEGTDGMLARLADMRRNGRLRVGGQRGVFVKAAKRTQDLRVDLPTIGPRTIELAREAQLAGLAVEAGKVLIADREACIALADRLGMFMVGLTRE